MRLVVLSLLSATVAVGCSRTAGPLTASVAFADVACARASDGIYCASWRSRGFGPLARWSGDFSDVAGWSDDDASARWTALRTPDLDGDGRTDVCLPGHGAVFCALRRTPEHFDPLRRSLLVDAVHGGFDVATSLAFPDLDGDGHPDVCVRLSDGLHCALGAGDGTFAPPTLWAAWPFTDADGAGEPAAVSSLRFADVDGDGLDDVCRRNVDDIVCARSTGSSFAQASGWIGPLPAVKGSRALAASYELGDVDGDGRADLCLRDAATASCFRSTGRAFALVATLPLPPGAATLHLGDVDGDGRQDLCVWYPGGVACATANGTGLAPFVDWERDRFAAARFDRAAARTLTLADVDGDGRTDVCGRTTEGLVCARSDGSAFRAVSDVLSDFGDAMPVRDHLDVAALTIGRRTQPTASFSNRTARENELAGTADWWVPYPQWSRAHEIEAYTDATSYTAGATVSVMLSTRQPGDGVEWTLFRTGFYGGDGARAIAAGRVVGNPQPLSLSGSHTAHAGWQPVVRIPLPADAVSGVWALRLDSEASGKSFFVTFVVREDARRAELVVDRADFTDAAYNDWDGGADRSSAYKGTTWVSLDRPLKSVAALDIYSFSSGYFVYEYPMVRWLESQGYDVKYVSNVDLDADATVLHGARAFLSVGHDEYWSAAMRDHVEAARDAGVHLGFFGSDSVDGRIRFGDHLHRVFSRTRSDRDASKLEYGDLPLDATKPPHDNPSDSLTGAHYGGWCSAVHPDCLADAAGKLRRADDFEIVESSHPIFRAVEARRLRATVGYEYEIPYEDPSRLPFTPHVLARASTVKLGKDLAPVMTAYRTDGGARVVNIGSMHWAHALDGWAGRAAFRTSGRGDGVCAAGALDCFTRPASAAAQITANVLADFGAAPATPSPELIETAPRAWP